MGTPELPGIRRRIYYITKNQIAQWPKYNRNASTRRTNAAVLVGNFILVADAKWKYIDILADKSQLTSEAQGEIPSQTQLNKLVAVHPGVGPEATAAACYLNNSDNVFIIEDMKGFFRVVGSEKWITKTTVAQDNGQGPTGSTSTTINVEATDEVPAPFYYGVIETEDGEIDCSYNDGDENQGANSGNSGNTGGNTSGNTGGNTSGNTGGNSGGNTGGNTGGGGSTASFSDTVTFNGISRNVSGGSVNITGPLTSMAFTGSNMDFIRLRYGNNNSAEASVAANGASASWSGSIAAPATVTVVHGNGSNANEVSWFTINVIELDPTNDEE